ncbi:MAG: hypothetical protein ACD_79C01179G0003 [uncultured bacterium]|nr:MAG: hypothetical protein ACD_79C01179G0003 [uncultured bacterium]
MQLSLRDVINRFDVSERVIYDWIEKKEMPFLKINEQYRFNYVSLLEWALENNIHLTPEILSIEEDSSEEQILSGALKLGDVHYDVYANNREEIIRKVVDILPLPEDTDRSSLFEVLWARESMCSTGIGKGIAIPHLRNPMIFHIENPIIMTCFLKQPIDFHALDGEPVSILFVMLTPSIKTHLTLLARLAFCLQDQKLKDYLHTKVSREELIAQFIILESRLNLKNTANNTREREPDSL